MKSIYSMNPLFYSQVPLIGETKPVSIHKIIAYQKNGCVKNKMRGPEPVKTTLRHLPIQVEQEENDSERYTEKSNNKDHCTIEINELETNV